MEDLYAAGSYRCLEQDEYADLVCDVIERLPAGMVMLRLTGDPHTHELVAPKWALAKDRTMALIRERLEQRDTWQGRLLGCARPE